MTVGKSFLNQAGLPIGLRNNNPGNIRPGSSWVGMTGINNNFVVFENVYYGLRALGIDITNKIKNGYNTITKIISRYAPPSENNTAAYINAVSDITGIDPNKILSVDVPTISALIRAIITHENGKSYADMITDADIFEGIKLMDQSLLAQAKAFFTNAPAVVTNSLKTNSGGVIIGAIAGVIAIICIIVYFKSKKNG